MHRSTLAKLGWILLFLAIATFYLWGLGALPLLGPDEPRYAQVAHEMLARRDFITPTLGGHPWFEKPPLLYWLMMAAFRVLGVTEYAARVGAALCGLATAGFVYWIGRSVSERSAGANHLELSRLSALIWLSSLGAIGFSRGASFDIVLTMTISGALAFWSAAMFAYGSPASFLASSPPRTWPLVGFYFFVGLSLLAKGLIGLVIILAVIGVYYLARREWPARQFTISLLWGTPLALAIAGVWYGPMWARHGWTFVDQFFVQHHFARFTSNKFHHPGPIYFYLPVLLAFALPWTVFLVSSIVSSRHWSWRGSSRMDRGRVLLFVWLIFPVVFFSLSGSKLTAYILPVLPAVALLVGERVVWFMRAGRGQRVARITGALLVVVGCAVALYLRRWLGETWIVIACSVLPLCVMGIVALVRPRLEPTMVMLIALSVFLTAIAGSHVAPKVAREHSVRDLLVAATEHGYGDAHVVQLHTVERTAEFYAANRIDYGPDREPVKFEGAMQVLDAARRNGGLVLCLVPTEFQSQLTLYQAVQTEVIGDNRQVALIAVRPK